MGTGGLALRLCRATAYVALTFLIVPLQAILLATKSPWSRRLPRAYHQICCRLLSFKIEQTGTPSTVHPTLFVANHTSYLDIPILGSVVEASFVAKAEIADWPFFGMLAKLQRSIFVDRRPRKTAEHRDAIMERLEMGDSLIIFPEATSSDGMHVLPFKSSLFSVAEYRPHGEPLIVQPVSVAYVRLDGMPLGRFYRPLFAWYGGMEVAPHIWTMMGLGSLAVRLNFHAPVTLAQFGSRKALSEYSYRVIARGLAAALAGREAEPARDAKVPETAEAG
jgi:lyso-ornithine lipid O-acyltransferase